LKESTFKLSQESADNYDNYLGAFLFEPYAIDIASRIQPENLKNILEIACGTGRTTYHLRKQLSSSTKITATDISA
jgi:ubiquinone/menaquinone biosynthesis C-methylase UbiE